MQEAIKFYESGRLDLAIEEVRKARVGCPQDANLAFMLGNALYRADNIEGAEAAYEDAIERVPGYFEARMSRGFALYELERFDEAFREWLEAMRLNTTSAFARAALAIGSYAVGRTDDAVIQYEEAVRLDNRYADIDDLSVDIRWKPTAVQTLEIIKDLAEEQKPLGSAAVLQKNFQIEGFT